MPLRLVADTAKVRVARGVIGEPATRCDKHGIFAEKVSGALREFVDDHGDGECEH